MRGILLAMLVAAGSASAGTSGVSPLPINGAVIGDAANATSPVETVQHWRWGSRGGHWRWAAVADIGAGVAAASALATALFEPLVPLLITLINRECVGPVP
jgi:hypothetical protein